jgi:Flp pilus assembly protein TadG
VEFALVLPLLAILVFGTVDLARAYQLENRLKNAAREGGRLAQDAPQQVVPNLAARCGAAPDNITYAATHEETGVSGNFTVTVTNQATNAPITGCTPGHSLPGGTRVRVRVSAPLHVLTPFIGNMVGNPVTVNGTYEVVVQGS